MREGGGGGGGGATVIPNLGIVGEIRLIKTFYSKFGCCVFICVTFWANQLFPILSQRILIRPCLFKYIYRHLFTILISKNYPLYLQLIAISEISPPPYTPSTSSINRLLSAIIIPAQTCYLMLVALQTWFFCIHNLNLYGEKQSKLSLPPPPPPPPP